MGSLRVLNTGAGDIKLSYDKSNVAEAIRAKRMITDMIRRGYVLLVKLEDGSYGRATGFDETRSEYLIADYDPQETAHEEEGAQPEAETVGPAEPVAKRKRGRPSKRVALERAETVAVARSAGG